MDPSRNIETIRQNSARADRLCAELLEPAADYFAGECFAASDLAEVLQERTLKDSDGAVTYLAFEAIKLDDPDDLDPDEFSALDFKLTITVEGPYLDGMYWPGMTERPLAPGDVIEDDIHDVGEGSGGLIIDLSECSIARNSRFFY